MSVTRTKHLFIEIKMKIKRNALLTAGEWLTIA